MSDVYVAIVSGRSVESVKKMVGLTNVTYAGNHGLEILHPDGTKFVHPMPLSFEEKVRTLLKELQEEVKKIIQLFDCCMTERINFMPMWNFILALPRWCMGRKQGTCAHFPLPRCSSAKATTTYRKSCRTYA